MQEQLGETSSSKYMKQALWNTRFNTWWSSGQQRRGLEAVKDILRLMKNVRTIPRQAMRIIVNHFILSIDILI